MYIINDKEVAILRAVLSSWLAMTKNPPLPVEEPTEELREAARKLFEELTR